MCLPEFELNPGSVYQTPQQLKHHPGFASGSSFLLNYGPDIASVGSRSVS